MSGVQETPEPTEVATEDPGRVLRVFANGDGVRLDLEADEGEQSTFRGPSCYRILVCTSLDIDQARALALALDNAIADALRAEVSA